MSRACSSGVRALPLPCRYRSERQPQRHQFPKRLWPTQFRTAYGLTSSGISTTTIAIVDAYDDPNIKSDLAVYSRQFGLPACTIANGCFRKVNQTGGTMYPAKSAGWSLEIALDVEISHAVCPNCMILLVEASSNSLANLLAAEDHAFSRRPLFPIPGAAENPRARFRLTSISNHLEHPITFSSGDSGYGVEYPASSQYVTAVGGTTLGLTTNNTRRSETVWNGAGSGCSAYEPKPTWQQDSGCVGRTIADVSADADPNTGAAIYDSVRYQGRAGWFQVGGTSLASPLVAAVYAPAGNAASTNDGSYSYSHLSGLFDVKSGSNGSCGGTYLCTGVTGYDGPTGNGTPIGTTAF